MKLNLGAGAQPMEGWENLDRKTGQEVFPLPVEAASAEVIRASHVLEHFSHHDTQRVLSNWVQALKPGGLLQVAVPNFETVARQYLNGQSIPVQGYVMGGQVDRDDYHRTIFDREALNDAMRAAGLLGITEWRSEIQDCASLPISLNLQGFRPPAKWPKVSAVMSMPRLSFTDNYFSAIEALPPLRINLRKQTGAFWGQCLTRAIEQSIDEEDPEYILTLDYDTVFTRQDVEGLLSAATRHPEADAIAALQASRMRDLPMFTIRGENGLVSSHVPRGTFDQELVQVATAHFGLTLIRADKLMAVERPWFAAEPGTDGRWGDDRTDEDIYFWRRWEAAGNSLYVAARVPVGHAELMIRWPGRDLRATYQHPSEFWETGRPEDSWR